MGKHKVKLQGSNPTLCFTKGQKDPISQKQFLLRQYSRIFLISTLQNIVKTKIKVNFLME